MRYLGNKSRLLHFIESVINKHNIEGKVFADIFAGTCSVGDYFKGKYKIIANDYMSFSSIICKAKLMNQEIPEFERFQKINKCTPFEWLNDKVYTPQENYFVYNNYTPVSDRMYFTESNAVKIDGMRLDIEEIYQKNVIDDKEYFFLLASLIESVLKVSNTSGTYQAFFKFWESRALKDIVIEPLNINSSKVIFDNTVHNEDSNKLVRTISGDIAYIDPPYTTTQYTNSYHVLETIANYDYPDLFGKTGRRCKRELSGYSNKSKAIEEFEDLFRQIQFKHILVSYSNQSIVSIEDLVSLASKFAVNNRVYVETHEYREYTTNNPSGKSNGKKLKEVIIYFVKDLQINKSPLNYSGSKDGLIPTLQKYMPKHIEIFVDAMGGAFNVGANIVATKRTIYNEYNKYVYEIIETFLTNNPEEIIGDIYNIIEKYNLCKKNKESYLSLRNSYNNNKDPLHLFVLQVYAFQNMIRFNSQHDMNTPVGNNEFNEGTIQRIKGFKTRTPDFQLLCGRYQDLDYSTFPLDTLFYFDPPYFITNAEYNDGKRGMDGWNAEKESELLNYILKLHNMGYKFMLSNVVKHKEKRHNLLIEWAREHEFKIIPVGKTGIKYPREEVIILNYMT